MHDLLLGAIAEDIASASGLAGRLHGAGLEVAVVFEARSLIECEVSRFDALVLVADTAGAPIDDAIALSVEAADGLRACGAQRLFLHDRSAFAGTPPAKLSALAEALADLLEVPAAPLALAAPSIGQALFKGHAFIGDTPLAIADGEANLARALAQSARSRPARIDHAHVRAGPAALHVAAQEAMADNRRLLVCDASTDEDMATIARVWRDAPLLIGSGDLAAQLGHALARTKASAPRIPQSVTVHARRLAHVGGQASASSSDAVVSLAAARDRAAIATCLSAYLPAGDGDLLHVLLDEPALAQTGAQVPAKADTPDKQRSQTAANAIDLLFQHGFDRLIIEGETAIAGSRRLFAHAVGEVIVGDEAGRCWLRLHGGPLDGALVAVEV